nr:MAG: capsid protein [Picobirnavirus sp.]
MAKENFQDDFAESEYKKGEEAGKQESRKSGSRKKPGKNGNKSGNSGSKPSSSSKYVVSTGVAPLKYLTKYPQIAEGAASVSFERAVGASLKLGVDPALLNAATSPSATAYQAATLDAQPGFPAIMQITTIDTLAGASYKNDAFNSAVDALYAFIRSKNTGVPPFDPAMVGLYVKAASEMVKLYTLMARGLGIASYIKAKTGVAPYYLTSACGFNYSEIIDNYPTLRAKLNMLALRMSGIPLPRSLEYVTESQWLYENVFKDATSEKAQMYVFVPAYFLELVEGDVNHPLTYLAQNQDIQYNLSATRDCSGGPNTLKFSSCLTALNNMIEAILGSEDCQRVISELLKAFGESSLIKINPIVDGLQIVPVYDKKVSSIIENMTVIWGGTDWSYTIAHDPSINGGAVIEHLWYPKTKFGNAAGSPRPDLFMQPNNLILNFHQDKVTWQDVMSSTILTCKGIDFANPSEVILPGEANAQTCYKLCPHGFTVAVDARIITTATTTRVDNSAGKSQFVVTSQTYRFQSFMTDNTFTVPIAQMCSLLASFDWHPTVYTWAMSDPDGNKNTVSWRQPLVDLDVYAYITADVLENIHDAAALSGFSSSELGVFTIK